MLIPLAITIVVLLLICGLLLYCVDLIPNIPPQVKQIAKVIIIILAVLVLLARVLPMAGVSL